MPWLRPFGAHLSGVAGAAAGAHQPSWITQGRFLPGQVQSGNRVLVYAGPITTPFMEDVLTFQFSVDGAADAARRSR